MTRLFGRADPITAGAVMHVAAAVSAPSTTGVVFAAVGVGFWMAYAVGAYKEADR